MRGTKKWITGGTFADYFTVVGRNVDSKVSLQAVLTLYRYHPFAPRRKKHLLLPSTDSQVNTCSVLGKSKGMTLLLIERVDTVSVHLLADPRKLVAQKF